MKRSLLLIPFAIMTCAGCNETDDRIVLLSSYDIWTKGDTKENFYIEGNNEVIDDLLSLSIPFIVYLTSETCSTCQQFAPIMDKWVENENDAVVRINEDQVQLLTQDKKDLFSTNINGTKSIEFPTVGIVKNEQSCEIIDYKSYMQTKNVFLNHMNNITRTTNIFYSTDNPLNIGPSTFTYISFDKENAEHKYIYSHIILSKTLASPEFILINNKSTKSVFEISLIQSDDDEKNYQSDLLAVTSSSTYEELEKYFNYDLLF